MNSPKKDSKKPVPAKQGSIGPVGNLEAHLKPDWWRNTVFNSLYLKTDGDVVDDLKITQNEVDYFISLLNPGLDDRILDLCCGQGRHSLELSRRGYKNLNGLDRSHYLIQRAKITAKKEGLSVKFREGDARKLAGYHPDDFEFVMILGNSFGYFETRDDDLNVLKEVSRVLKPGGRVLLDVTDGDYVRKNFEPRSWEWIDKRLLVARERSLSKNEERLISREVITSIEKGVIADQFYAERLYNEQELKQILEEAGFSDSYLHSSLSPDSQRNQDLGMMKQRLVFTADIKKQSTPKRVKKPEIKNVAVIMGDPSKSDIVKPNSSFGEDDFNTINLLKTALEKIGGYNFIYLNNHNTLQDDLRRLNGKLNYAFNLCDEGFDNDPRKELHVPGMLDLLEIPYTGAGPQCLAHCYDKSMIRGMAREMMIPVPEAFLVKSGQFQIEIPEGTFPVIIKPNFGDSSFGITKDSVVYNPEQLLNAISEVRRKFGYEKPMLVEEFLTGKDLTIGIIGNLPSDFEIMGISEDDYSDLPEDLPKICGYEAKWDPQSPYSRIKTIPAELTPEQKDTIIKSSLELWERLDFKDYGRFDWRLDSHGNPKLLEANPNPGWCWDGHLAKISGYKDINYSEMLFKILKAAEQRYNGLLANRNSILISSVT